MNKQSIPKKNGIATFRGKLLLAIMLLVTTATGLGLFVAQRNIAAEETRDLERQFKDELALLHSVQEIRNAALAERCRALAHKPRIHAALEDNALDLLYPSARDELLDVLGSHDADGTETALSSNAVFYRFLNDAGTVISPPSGEEVGNLTADEASLLALKGIPTKSQTGYLWRALNSRTETVDEVIAMPIVSSETGLPIAALELGLKPTDLTGNRANPGFKSGIWTEGRLAMLSVSGLSRQILARRMQQELDGVRGADNAFRLDVDGAPSLVIYNLLNPGSVFPAAYEICVYPLTDYVNRQHRLIWQFCGLAFVLLAGGYLASHLISWRFSVPVEKLAAVSEENRNKSEQMEAALEISHEELQRSARFSADASHQLKTPVTVLRAGLEELLAGEELSNDTREEVSALVHQTFRLTGVIEDLLLLSRLDAGRLKLELSPLDVVPVIEAWLDDFSALPDPLDLKIETDYPVEAFILGEKGYTSIILQNLLENARKYNRQSGVVKVNVRAETEWTIITISNTGAGIERPSREHIFERFHRGSAGENNPGHGLGLNLARELARLHGGELNLVRSDAEWTEFEVKFCTAANPTQ